jgi:hypothetical protein
MSATVIRAARVLAIGVVLSVAGSAPAWSQSLIGDGVPAGVDTYGTYYRGPAPYAAPYAYAPQTARVRRHHH